MKVAKDLIPVKMINFVFQAGLACFMPYKSLYQKQLGLSPAQNGIIQSVEKIIGLVSPPVAGALADKLSVHKVVLIVSLLASIVVVVPMYFVPPIPPTDVKTIDCCLSSSEVLCNGFVHGSCSHNITLTNYTYQVFCGVGFLNSSVLNCELKSDGSAQVSILSTSCDGVGKVLTCELEMEEPQQDKYGVTFTVMLVLTIFYACFLSPVQPLIDAATMNMLGPKRMHKYGQQRLWGSVGFGTVAFITGFLVDIISPLLQESEKNYLSSFVGSAVFGCITAFVCYWIKVPSNKAKSILAGARVLLCNCQILLFLFMILISGYALGVKYAFVYWYAESLPGASQSIIGLSILLACFSEIPVFFISGWVCRKVGLDVVLSFGLLVAGLRCFLYTFMTDAWQLLLIECLHGLSFAFPMAAMCSKAVVLAPKDMTATLMGITQGVYWGLGNMMGALIGGILYGQVGSTFLFRSTAVINVVVAILYLGCQYLLSRCSTATNNSADPKHDANKHELQDEPVAGNPLIEVKSAVPSS